MRVVRGERAAARTARRQIGRDVRRALFAGLCLASLLALGSRFDGLSSILALLGSTPRPLGEDLATGTIVLVPWIGDECRLRLIDNATWRIFEQGVVECRNALAPMEARGYGGYAMRVDMIREGFRNR